MSIQLFRIDDRLIHGQVVLGWASALKSNTLLVCDDSIVCNDWEKELYLSCAPDYLNTIILDESKTICYINDKTKDLSKTIILVNNPFIVEHLLDHDCVIDKVNVGGIHFKEGRKNILPYLYLDDEEIASFKRCMERGVSFECLDVPTGNKINLKNLL